MDYIIMDLEWNQPGLSSVPVSDPFDFTSEIVEFGAIRLDSEFRQTGDFLQFVKPVFYPEMSGRIARLTGIRDRELREAPGFSEALDRFFSWCGEDFALMTWGPDDVPVLMDNMAVHGIDTDPMPPCYDLQRIFGYEILRENRKCSLEAALQILGIPQDNAHDALDDARSTALIADRMDLAEYMEEFATCFYHYGEDRINSISYPSRDEILQDDSLRRFTCPFCGEELHGDEWTPVDGTYWCQAQCTEGDAFLLSVRVRKKAAGLSARRWVRSMSDDLWDTLQSRRETSR